MGTMYLTRRLVTGLCITNYFEGIIIFNLISYVNYTFFNISEFLLQHIGQVLKAKDKQFVQYLSILET